MILLTWLMAGAALWLLLPTISDFLSLVSLPFRRAPEARPVGKPGADPIPILFLIPAHDEEMGIRRCVESLSKMDYPEAKRTIVVVADNCTDGTAAVAREAGATVLERTDPERPGKPRALEWGLNQLSLDDHDAVVVIDADTVVDPDMAAHIAAKGSWKGRAGQVYDGVGNPRENALTRMALVFANLRYLLAYPLKEAAGLNVPLQGNGMVFGADLLAKRGWEAFSICEDWEIYAILTADGVQSVGCPAARLYAEEASSLTQSNSQRQRWAGGKTTVMLRYTWPVLRSRIGFRQKLDALAELTHLGPAAHLALVVLLSAVLLLLPIPGASLLLAALWITVLRIGVYTMVALRYEERPIRTLASFLYLPFYAVWRFAVQISSFSMVGDKPWVRTQRSS